MAFSSSPQFNTEQVKPINFDGTDFYRSGDLTIQRDMQLTNVFYDRVSQENKTRAVAVKKRPGLSANATSLQRVAPTDPIRGYFNDTDQNAMYWVVKDKVWVVRMDTSFVAVLVTTLSTTTGYVGFCSYLKSTGTRYVLFSDGTDLWVDNYVAVSCNKVVDPDMPTPHVPCPVYLDGYVLLIKSGTSDLYNSDVDDPTAWTAGEFISAEISSDASLKVIKAKNYLAVLGYNSVEYFWDAGNATGSPFSRNDSAFRAVGYINGLCTIGDTTYFIGKESKQNTAIYALNSFKVERISNSVVDRTLQSLTNVQNTKSPFSTGSFDGHSVSCDGHTFYVIVLDQTTWAYDVDERFWYEWRGSDGTGLKIEAAWNMYSGSAYCAITNQTFMSTMHPATYRDFNSNFTCKYVTESWDGDTMNWKTCSRVILDCDRTNNTGTSNIQLSWSDKDWADGGVTPRNINIFSESPFTVNTGKFRKRSYKIEYADNYPIRMYGLTQRLNYLGN